MLDLRTIGNDPEFTKPLNNFNNEHQEKTNKLINKFKNTGKIPKIAGNPWKNLKEFFLEKQQFFCAICEFPLTSISGTDIEHYRPKRHYWWLAYDSYNYYLACSDCNRLYKKSKFPLFDESKKVDYDKRNKIDQEEPLLFNPFKHNPIELFELIFLDDPNTNLPGLIALKPKPNLNDYFNKLAEETINLYKLHYGINDSTKHKSKSQMTKKSQDLYLQLKNGGLSKNSGLLKLILEVQ